MTSEPLGPDFEIATAIPVINETKLKTYNAFLAAFIFNKLQEHNFPIPENIEAQIMKEVENLAANKDAESILRRIMIIPEFKPVLVKGFKPALAKD